MNDDLEEKTEPFFENISSCGLNFDSSLSDIKGINQEIQSEENYYKPTRFSEKNDEEDDDVFQSNLDSKSGEDNLIFEGFENMIKKYEKEDKADDNESTVEFVYKKESEDKNEIPLVQEPEDIPLVKHNFQKLFAKRRLKKEKRIFNVAYQEKVDNRLDACLKKFKANAMKWFLGKIREITNNTFKLKVPDYKDFTIKITYSTTIQNWLNWTVRDILIKYGRNKGNKSIIEKLEKSDRPYKEKVLKLLNWSYQELCNKYSKSDKFYLDTKLAEEKGLKYYSGLGSEGETSFCNVINRKGNKRRKNENASDN